MTYDPDDYDAEVEARAKVLRRNRPTSKTVILPEYNVPEPHTVARDRQVAGQHYQNEAGIQPWDIWEAFDLDPWAANALKYLLRAGRKGPALTDYQKAAHYLEFLIEREEAKR